MLLVRTLAMEIAIEKWEACNVSYLGKGVVQWKIINNSQCSIDVFELYQEWQVRTGQQYSIFRSVWITDPPYKKFVLLCVEVSLLWGHGQQVRYCWIVGSSFTGYPILAKTCQIKLSLAKTYCAVDVAMTSLKCFL